MGSDTYIADMNSFVKAVAAKLATFLKEDAADPEYLSQREAFKRFGEGNVRRWRQQGKIEPCKRPGKIEYKTSTLKELSRTVQDYFSVVSVQK